MSKAKQDNASIIARNQQIIDAQIESLGEQLAYLQSLRPQETDTDAEETTLDKQITQVQGVINTITAFLQNNFGDEESTIDQQTDVIKKVLEYIRSIPVTLAVWGILEIQILEYITQLATPGTSEPRLTPNAIKILLLRHFPGVFVDDREPVAMEMIGAVLNEMDGVTEEENTNVDTAVAEENKDDNVAVMVQVEQDEDFIETHHPAHLTHAETVGSIGCTGCTTSVCTIS